jgi:predicted dehydrogenase
MTRKLRWGVLGTAGIARGQVIPAIQQSSNGSVGSVASRDPAKAKAFAAELGIPRVAESYAALVADPAIDAVYIPLPNSEHAEWAIKAAAAGKAVLCEKPLAMNAAEARRIVTECAARKVPLMEGFMYRFHPQNVRVMELIKSGAIGEVREVRTHLSVDLMSPPDATNVRFDPAIGGGALLDMGCYVINIARRVMGAEPESVQGVLDIDPRFNVDVGAAGILGFSGGRLGLVSCSFRASGQGAYSIVGTTGTIDVPRAVIPGMGTRAPEGLVIVIDADGRRREEIFAPINQYTIMAEGFADAVLSGRPVPFSPEDGVANMAVMDALTESAKTGRRTAVAKH